MRILLLKGKSQYNALRAFLDDAYRAFEAQGHEVIMLDLMSEGVMANFVELATKLGPFDFAFSFIICGEYRDRDGRNVGEIINAPHIIQHVDHPFTHMDRVLNTPKNAVLLTIDQSHADLLNFVFGNGYFAYCGFNPHPALGDAIDLPATGSDYLASRPIKIMFAGTYYKPEEPPWKNYPANIQAVFNEASNIALSNDWFPPHMAIIEVMRSRGLEADDENIRTLLPHAYAVHEWVRKHRRFQFLKAAAKAKLPITLFGNGYDKDIYRYKSMDYRGPAEFHEVLAHLRQTRVLLNVNVNFGEGSHERPLCAMLAGAVAMSEPSKFYDTFQGDADNPKMAHFRWSSLDHDLSKVHELVEDGDLLLRVAHNARQEAEANHRSESRVQRLIEIAKTAWASPQWSSVQ